VKITKAGTFPFETTRNYTSPTVKNEVKKRRSFALLQNLHSAYVCTRSWLIDLTAESNIQMSKTVQKFLNPNPDKPKVKSVSINFFFLMKIQPVW